MVIKKKQEVKKTSNLKVKAKSESKRIELLNEAAKILNRKGVSQTSLSLVAKSVGVSRASLYYYVDDLQDLIYQCYTRTCFQLTGLLEESVKNNTNALDVIDYFVANALDEKREEFASLNNVAFLDEEQHNVVLGLYKGVHSLLADIILKGVASNQLRPCQPRIIASVILGVIAWVPVSIRSLHNVVDSFSSYCDIVRDLLKYGIAFERVEAKAFSKFDLSSFFTFSGNVFDADVRIAVRSETLLVAASWLFNQKGIDATSLEEIAASVGVTKKVIYHNIGGKEVLVIKCYERSFRFFNFVDDTTIDFKGTRLDALSNALVTLAAASMRRDIAPLLPLAEDGNWSGEIMERFHSSVENLMEKGLIVFNAGIEEGSIREIDQKAMLILRPGFYEWLPSWGGSLTEEELEQSPQELTEMYCLGLAPL